MPNLSEPQVSKTFHLLITTKLLKIKAFLLSNSQTLYLSGFQFLLPQIGGILTFMSRIKFMFRYAEHEKMFVTSKPDPEALIFSMLNSAEHEISCS